LLKAVIFDMDGVIIDSEPMHARAALLALSKYNVKVTLDYLYQFIGTTTYHVCQTIIKEFGLTITAEELLEANNECKKELLLQEGHEIVPYVIPLIENLYQHGLKLIIASSSPSEAIEEVMDSLQIRKYFSGYVSGNMVAHPKPAPDIFLLAAKQLGVDPSECIVIEDSYNGVTAAAAAGITSLGYLNPNSGAQDLSKAAMLVEGFDEVDYPFVNKVYQYDHMESVTILHTSNFTLRELTPQDAESLCEICRKPELRKYIDNFTDDIELEAKKLEAYMKNIYHYYGFGIWGVFLRDSNRLIGRCGVEYKKLENEDIYELSYFLDPTYQGKGYAKEFTGAVIEHCFDQLAIPQITAIIDKQNLRSIRFAKSLGMNYRGECIRDNKAYDRYELVKK
jgi:beta-phosphoglucomutase family hydrolase